MFQAILLTLINEYTDWSRPSEHPINLLDSTADILGDALVVAPLMETADLFTKWTQYHHSASSSSSSHSSSASGPSETRGKSFLYVFVYQVHQITLCFQFVLLSFCQSLIHFYSICKHIICHHAILFPPHLFFHLIFLSFFILFFSLFSSYFFSFFILFFSPFSSYFFLLFHLNFSLFISFSFIFIISIPFHFLLFSFLFFF